MMRELNECREEIFWRSAKRMEAHRKTRSRVYGWGTALCLLLTVCAVTILPPGETGTEGAVMDGFPYLDKQEDRHEGIISDGPQYGGVVDGIDGIKPDAPVFGTLDSFSFSLTWGCYGVSSYDSETGKLVKTTDATHPEDYVTTYQLTHEQRQQIYDLVKDLNVTAYPSTYDPHGGGVHSSPSMTLILSVKTDKVQKTITAADIAFTFDSKSAQGQRFLSVCKAIRDMLMETEEWEDLPEYEFFYD